MWFRIWAVECVAILVLSTIVATFSTVSNAQERPFEVSVRLASFNTYYQENFKNPADGDPEDVRGNSWQILGLNLDATFHVQRVLQHFPLPLFLSVDAQESVATEKGREIGEEFPADKPTELTQEENVAYSEFTSRFVIGWEFRSYVQPYVGFSQTVFSGERTGQQNGNSAGVLIPDPNQDYTERVNSEGFTVGVRGSVPISNSSEIIQYDAWAEKPTSVFVTNDYFGSGMWGQGTTGYAFGARAELDIPIHRAPWENPMYFAIGGSVTKREWDGNGASAIVWNVDYSQTVRWPQNFYIEAGGYVGLTMSF